MSLQAFHCAIFGPQHAGIVTCGYRLYNPDGTPNGARITASITERAPGTYAAIVTLPDSFQGEIRWDTGGGSPVFASALVNPGDIGVTLDTIAARIIDDHGTGSYVEIGGGSGTGAFLVSITVRDSGTLQLLQNVHARVSEGINQFVSQTDVNGVALFSLDAATYELMLTKDGYEFTPMMIVVTGAGNFNATMFQIAIPVELGGIRLELGL